MGKIDDFLNDFSEHENSKKNRDEQEKQARQKAIDDIEKFKINFQLLSDNVIKPKLIEFKTKISGHGFSINFDEKIKQIQSDKIVFQITIQKANYQDLVIKITGNTRTKRINISRNAKNAQDLLSHKNYEYALEDLDIDILEKVLIENLNSHYGI